MNPETKTAAVVEEGINVLFPPHLTQNYEKANQEMMEAYGHGPGVEALIRMTVACWTSARIRREFERAVLEIRRRTLNPPETGEFDEDCI
jgi:hypothetical protein